MVLPFLTKLPFKWLYPTGKKQEQAPLQKYQSYFKGVEIIAGDFLLIRKYMPIDLTGRIIITNTTTEKDVEEMQKRGLKILVTYTPRIEGRSFGTNVMEAMLLSLIDKPQNQIANEDFRDLIKKIPLVPNIEELN